MPRPPARGLRPPKPSPWGGKDRGNRGAPAPCAWAAPVQTLPLGEGRIGANRLPRPPARGLRPSRPSHWGREGSGQPGCPGPLRAGYACPNPPARVGHGHRGRPAYRFQGQYTASSAHPAIGEGARGHLEKRPGAGKEGISRTTDLWRLAPARAGRGRARRPPHPGCAGTSTPSNARGEGFLKRRLATLPQA